MNLLRIQFGYRRHKGRAYLEIFAVSFQHLPCAAAEMNGHGHDFGHEFVSEFVSEADSDTDTKFFRTSDTDSDTDMDSDKVMSSDTDTTSDTGMSANLGHGLGHGQTSDTRVRSSLCCSLILIPDMHFICISVEDLG